MFNVTDMGKKFSIAQYRTYAPIEGTRKPIKSKQFQFLTLIANFRVTTMITLV